MHIAFWSPAWPLALYQNGIITYVHWMKRVLEDGGHRVSVFTGELGGGATDPDVHPVRRTPWHPIFSRMSPRSRSIGHDNFSFGEVIGAHMQKVHRSTPIDIIEMEESFGWCADVARITAIPLLVKLHGPAFLSLVEDERDTSFGVEKIAREGRALANAPAIVSPSSLTLVQTLEHYRLTPKITGHIDNPLTMDVETPVWRLDACNRNVILFVGRFDLRKGGDIVLEAFLSILKTRPSLRLVFIGPDLGLSGADGKKTRFKSFRDSLFPAKFRESVQFRGRMANRDIAKLRVEAMVTIMASRWENQGYALLEAMYQGCPVVSSDAGGSGESIVHGRTGLLAKSGDPSDFAAKICAMLDDGSAASAMGVAARRQILERHSASTVASKSLDMYERLTGSHDA